jgi:hypothetical protein
MRSFPLIVHSGKGAMAGSRGVATVKEGGGSLQSMWDEDEDPVIGRVRADGEGVERAGDEVAEEGNVFLDDLEVNGSCNVWECRVSHCNLFYCCVGAGLGNGHELTDSRTHCRFCCRHKSQGVPLPRHFFLRVRHNVHLAIKESARYLDVSSGKTPQLTGTFFSFFAWARWH